LTKIFVKQKVFAPCTLSDILPNALKGNLPHSAKSLEPPGGYARWLGAWTIAFALDFLYRYLDDLARQHHGTFTVRFIEQSTGIYSAALLFLLVIAFARHFKITERNWHATIPAHFLAAMVFSLVHTSIMAISRIAIFRIAGLGSYDYGIMSIRYPMEMANDMIMYSVGVILIHLWDHYRESRDRELRTAQLETQLAQAQLQALQAQVHPHFLFNALNTISSVIYEDVEAADTMIARLSEFLRHTLNASRSEEVSLDEELKFLNLYLDIMRPRFEERLEVDFSVENGIGSALVPNLILQPLVENSIRHAADPVSGSVHITVAASRQNGALLLEVKDDGPGLVNDQVRRSGLGLRNTSDRLERLYGNAHGVSMRNVNDGGLEITVLLPFHTTHQSRSSYGPS